MAPKRKRSVDSVAVAVIVNKKQKEEETSFDPKDPKSIFDLTGLLRDLWNLVCGYNGTRKLELHYVDTFNPKLHRCAWEDDLDKKAPYTLVPLGPSSYATRFGPGTGGKCVYHDRGQTVTDAIERVVGDTSTEFESVREFTCFTVSGNNDFLVVAYTSSIGVIDTTASNKTPEVEIQMPQIRGSDTTGRDVGPIVLDLVRDTTSQCLTPETSLLALTAADRDLTKHRIHRVDVASKEITKTWLIGRSVIPGTIDDLRCITGTSYVLLCGRARYTDGLSEHALWLYDTTGHGRLVETFTRREYTRTHAHTPTYAVTPFYHRETNQVFLIWGTNSPVIERFTLPLPSSCPPECHCTKQKQL